jgi:DNA-binding NtrC family response regulator
VEDLPAEITSYNRTNALIKSCLNCHITHKLSFRETIICLEANLVSEALNHCSGNKLAAAKLLDLPASTFNDKMKKYNLDLDTIFCAESKNT